jgi:hypothetical protein
VHAVAVVDNERLTSIEFDMPAAGGVRTILAAGVGVGTPVSGASTSAPAHPEAPAAPATAWHAGPCGDTRLPRVPGRHADGVLPARHRQPGAPASDAGLAARDRSAGGRVRRGAARGRFAAGRREGIASHDQGPLPPGVTQVPIAFRLETWTDPWVLEQTFPLPIENVALAVQKLGDMRLQSAQTPTVRETSLQGTPFILATGSSLPAGTALSVTVSGVPHRNRWPVYLTLALAVAIALWGAWDRKQLARPMTSSWPLIARSSRPGGHVAWPHWPRWTPSGGTARWTRRATVNAARSCSISSSGSTASSTAEATFLAAVRDWPA